MALLAFCLALTGVGCRTRLPRRPPLDPDNAAACARLFACARDAFIDPNWQGVGLCVYLSELVTNTDFGSPSGSARSRGKHVVAADLFFQAVSRSCLQTADCAEVSRCAIGDPALDCPWVNGGGARCDGDAVTFCGDNNRSRLRVDCAEVYGERCVATASGGALCGVGPCDATAPWCVGNVRHVCDRGVDSPLDCGADSTCRDGACLPSSNSATACAMRASPSVGFCDGSDRVDCRSAAEPTGPFEFRRRCADELLVGTCNLGAGWVCLPTAGEECSPAEFRDRCEGGNLIYCDGVEQPLDCVALGFFGCVVESDRATCR